MIYINTKTGAEIETESIVTGGDWMKKNIEHDTDEDLVEEPTEKDTKEKKPKPEKKEKEKK